MLLGFPAIILLLFVHLKVTSKYDKIILQLLVRHFVPTMSTHTFRLMEVTSVYIYYVVALTTSHTREQYDCVVPALTSRTNQMKYRRELFACLPKKLGFHVCLGLSS